MKLYRRYLIGHRINVQYAKIVCTLYVINTQLQCLSNWGRAARILRYVRIKGQEGKYIDMGKNPGKEPITSKLQA